jgi:hypothetical protein
MKKYKVWLEFRFTDTVHVEAETEKEAELKALDESEPMYEAYVDTTITEEE